MCQGAVWQHDPAEDGSTVWDRTAGGHRDGVGGPRSVLGFPAPGLRDSLSKALLHGGTSPRPPFDSGVPGRIGGLTLAESPLTHGDKCIQVMVGRQSETRRLPAGPVAPPA